MLGKRFAGSVYDRIKRLAEAGIEMHCQIVLIPEVNNGEELRGLLLNYMNYILQLPMLQ